uniref:Uncharacterized protein n=1 Tax=Rhizophora mucronata TaxID=61149 RepID=A0A2P2QDB0_RHIMU
MFIWKVIMIIIGVSCLRLTLFLDLIRVLLAS